MNKKLIAAILAAATALSAAPFALAENDENTNCLLYTSPSPRD